MTTLDPSSWAIPIKEGSLLKKGHVRKNWKWRWFRLQDKNLFYFRTRDPNERPIGHIDLQNYMVKKTPSQSRPYGFGLFSPKYPPYPLAALYEEDYQDWLKYLKIATKGRSKLPPNESPTLQKEKSSREIGISKCHTDPVTGTFVNAMPPTIQTRTRNRSTSSGETRNVASQQNSAPTKRTHKKHLSLVSPLPTVYLNNSELFLQQEKIAEDPPSSEEDEVENNFGEDESDGEFDIADLIEKKKQIDLQYGTGDSEWVRSSPKSGFDSPNCKFLLGESNGSLQITPGNTPTDPILTQPTTLLTSTSQPSLSTSQPSLTTFSEGARKETFIRLTKPLLSPRKDLDIKIKLEKTRTNPHRFSRNVDIDMGYVEDLRRFSMTTGRKLTTEDYDEADLVTSPEMSPRGEEILMMADMDMAVQRKLSRSLGLMDAIIEEISEETIVVDDPQDNADKEEKKVSWRAIRRSILPSADLLSMRVKGGNHRGFAPHELAILAEEEEKDKIRRLKEQYLVKGDPLLKYNIAARSIGKGAVGEVFFATNKEDDTRVAIKKLQLERRGKNRLPLILREIEIIATSAHQNIVRYLETYQMGTELWVVMEYMSYGSMYDLVKLYPRGCRLDEALTGYCIREVIKAVDFLHNKKRIHRDIKVDNILVNSEGEVKLADFGTAVQLTFQRLRRTTLAGTPYYMAPELIQRIPYNEKVDIWSIGITVVEIMNGKPPFYELDPREALDAIVMKGVKGLVDPKQSDLIKDFVNNRCLCAKPEERSTTTQLLTHPFLQMASPREQFAKFLLQSSVMYHLEGSVASGGCTIL